MRKRIPVRCCLNCKYCAGWYELVTSVDRTSHGAVAGFILRQDRGDESYCHHPFASQTVKINVPGTSGLACDLFEADE